MDVVDDEVKVLSKRVSRKSTKLRKTSTRLGMIASWAAATSLSLNALKLDSPKDKAQRRGSRARGSPVTTPPTTLPETLEELATKVEKVP